MKYTVTIDTDPIAGSGMAAAEYQGYGEAYLQAYLESRLPAGSPVTVEDVATSRQNFSIGFKPEDQSRPAPESGPGSRCECGAPWDASVGERGGYTCAR